MGVHLAGRLVLKGETNYKYELRTDCLRATMQ